MSIAIKATCMVCGQITDCYNCVDIGWICVECFDQAREDAAKVWETAEETK